MKKVIQAQSPSERRDECFGINAVAFELAIFRQPAVELIQRCRCRNQLASLHLSRGLSLNRLDDIGRNGRFGAGRPIAPPHEAVPFLPREIARCAATGRFHQIRHVRVPDAGGAVLAAGEDFRFILAPRRLPDTTCVAGELDQFGAGGGIPDAGGAVVAAGEDFAIHPGSTSPE